MLKTQSKRDPRAGHCQDGQGERERKCYEKKNIYIYIGFLVD